MSALDDAKSTGSSGGSTGACRHVREIRDVTPILVLLLGVIGLGAITGYLDFVLLPALAVFLGLAVYAGARQRQATGGACCTPHQSESRKP